MTDMYIAPIRINAICVNIAQALSQANPKFLYQLEVTQLNAISCYFD